MRSRERQIQFRIIFIVFSLFASGCASPYLLLKQKPTIALKQNEGVMLFSSKFNNKDRPDQKNIFWVSGVTLQEVNQYKPYGAKRPFSIPLPKENYIQQDDLFLFSLKLPRGTYKITSLDGMFRSFFATQYFVAVNKIFDVTPGQISYAGRLGIDFFILNRQQTHETKIEDKFEEDEGRFKSGYPALQNQTIIKELIY